MSGPDYNVMHNPTMMSGPYMTPEQVMAQANTRFYNYIPLMFI